MFDCSNSKSITGIISSAEKTHKRKKKPDVVPTIFKKKSSPIKKRAASERRKKKAFLEVGVSSYLENAVYHAPETGWTLATPWIVTSRNGFFEATASGGKGFHDKFITPEPGIYFIALNLHMANTTAGFLKASLVINGEFEEANGFEAMHGKTTALRETISLSGFLRLYENDAIALYLKGSEGSLLADSTFSVMQMSRIGSVPGFHAILSRDQVIQPQIMSRIENWRTSGTKGLFMMHSGTSPSVGLFCAILEGSHKFTSNINIESDNQLTDCILAIVLNSKSTLVKRYSSGAKKYSTSLSGMFYLNRGDCVELRIQSTSSGHVTVLFGSSFSGLFLGLKRDVTQQFSASLVGQSQVGAKLGWNAVDNWVINSSRRNFQSEEMILRTNHSTFISKTSRLFLVTALVNMNGSKRNSKRLLVAVKEPPSGLTGNSGLSAEQSFSSGPSSLIVSGVVKLDKGDTVTVYIQSDANDNEMVDGLFCVSVVSYDWPGVTATLTERIIINSPGWTKVAPWKTHDASDGLFSFDNAFFSANGVYRPHQEGTYFVSCNVIFDGGGKGNLSAVIAIDDVIDTGNGLYSLNENPKRVVTLNVAGSMRLKNNQNISIYVKTTVSSSWNVAKETDFSVVLIGADSLSTTGFLAVKQEEASQSSSCGEIGRWRAIQPVVDSFFNNSAQFNSTSGRFRAKEDGLYLTSANILIHHSGLSRISMSIVLDGQPGKIAVSTFQPIPSNSPSGKTVDTETFDSGVCTDNKLALSRIMASSEERTGESVADTRISSVPCKWSVMRSMATGGGQLAYIDNNIFNPNPTLPSDEGDFTASLSGTYLISVMFTLKGNASDNVTACVGIRKCGECYIEVSNTVRQHNSTSGFVGLVDLEKGELISTCLKSKDQAFSLITATRSVQFMSVVELNRTVQLKHRSIGLSTSSSGWHELVEWETRSGKSLQNVYVNENGLYILSTNVQLAVDVESLVGVKIETTGSPIRDVLSILSNSETGSTVTYSVAVVARLNASEAIAVSVFSNSQYLRTSNITFFAALVTKDNRYPCLSLRSKTSRYDSGEWWKGIEHWESVDTQCVSPNSDFTKGIFVADVAGVYFLAAVVVVRTSHLSHQTRLVELLLSVNGDTINTNGLKATQGVTDGLSVVLSLSATAYLEPWQTLYLMIRSTGVGAFEVVNGSTFSVALIEETKFYKTVAANITHFDNGPRVIRHPPPSASLGEDLGLNVSWTCDAVAKGNVVYNWLKNDQIITSTRDLSLKNVQVSDSGRYVCQAEYDNIKVFSQAAELHVFDTTPRARFEQKVFTAQENSNASFELKFSALDKQHRPANVSLDIIKGNTNDTFVLSSGVSKDKFTMRNRIPLDHETKNLYRLTLAATNQDSRKTTTVNVTVIISDVNDNPPIFTNRTVNISVQENVANGTVIFQAKATDEDSTNNSVITYTLLCSEGEENFAMDASSGIVTVTGNLDRETRSEMILYIQATDGKFRATTTLVITVLDVNEFTPVFHPQYYKRRVSETALLGEPVIQVIATDKDLGKDSRIFYNITSGNVDSTFSIDTENGTIILQKPLDYETLTLYELRVQASDDKFSSGAIVSIQVVDYNDNSPIFSSTKLFVFRSRNVTTGHLVGSVNASDKDSYDNADIHYSISSVGNYDKFAINSSTGDIFTVTTLDTETVRNYVILVKANDTGNPSRESTTLVTITATDVNDNTPEFVQRSFTVNISEASVIGTNIVCLSTTDRDSMQNAQITYSIAEGNVNDTFKVTVDGVVVLQRQLDRETVQLYNLTIAAENSGAIVSQSRDTAIVIINIVDVNDNSPVFERFNYSFSVPENATTNHFVGSVEASDRDSYENAHMFYSIPSVSEKFG
ncbi:Cadherin EGF LAG seven-pass G-type receptor 2 [Desmophyllum pertusum]|uniref:Cadherin EGF LAG seven-pass G-type receptor 2 n=1 Tax=Desmophyllum pertusum TaxID=174260 RepID=A0A9X0A6B4_9CNID|nr:Cadherin EGF LAG seven-pass G-type receptor 2 [Desmophyllum pertusum]